MNLNILIAVSCAALITVCGIKKIWKRKIFLLLMAGSLAGIGLAAFETSFGDGANITYLTRNPPGNGSTKTDITAVGSDGSRTDITVEVPAFNYSEEETAEILDNAYDSLDAIILGNNTGFDHIDSDLNFIESIGDDAVTISWHSYDPEIINSKGEIGSGIDENGEKTTVKATLKLNSLERRYEREITVFPKKDRSTEEILSENIITANENNETQEYILPKSVNGTDVSWYEKKECRSGILSALIVIIGAFVYASGKEKVRKDEEKRSEGLNKEYPELVSRLLLLLHAGMACRKAFMKMDEDYRRAKSRSPGYKSYVLEEVSIACMQMNHGISEADAYRKMSERCALPNYKTLALLLEQNLKKGSSGLMTALEQETLRAFEEHKRQARAAGEKASVKLLMPMGMMLIVVLVIIVVPAMMSF